MGALAMKRLIMAMAMQRDRRRRKAKARDASIPMSAKAECSFRSRHQDQDSEAGGKRMKYSSGPDLPEDIWHHIYSLVPMQDAARAACVSRAFRRRWRCYPNLSFSNLIVDWNGDIHVKHEPAREFSSRVNQVLTNHSGGLKTLRLEFIGPSSSDCCSLDKWLQVAITPVIEELSFQLSSALATYSFPCSLLSDLSGNSIRHLHLAGCAFRPAVRFSCLRSLAQLHLYHVGIKEDELGCLLSSCQVLELFAFGNCSEITCLKIPRMLDRLRKLHIVSCNALRAIESKAPNLFSLYFVGKRVQLSLGEPLQLEKLVLSHPRALDDARATLPSIAPNLQTLRITSCLGAINPMMHSRFLYLKFLNIWVHTYPFHGANDYMSLVSFLDACPSLETFTLTTPTEPMEHESIIGDPSHLRRMPGHRHDKLKSMKVLGFNSAKSLIELTVHIIENAGSLESLSLDTTYYAIRCSDGISDTCSSMRERTRMEAPRALLAIQTHIQGKVPSTVKLDVLEPCSRCHAS